MKKSLLVVIIIMAVTGIHKNSVTYADVISLVADNWCPYNCTPNTDTQGFMIEIAKYAFERAGHTLAYTRIPWSRAIQETRSGKHAGIVGVGRDEAPDFIFPAHELGVAAHTFFVKQGSPWRFAGLASLDQISLGVIRNYSYGDLYERYIKPNEGDEKRIQIVSGGNGLMQNIRKLSLERIDALVEDRTVFNYFLRQTKTPDLFSEAGVAYTEKVYIAFSPEHSNAQKYADILSAAMPELRTSGKLAEILEKYGVHDWVE